MGHMQINDIGMEPIGDHLRGVRVLRLGYCVQISDEGLAHLAGEIDTAAMQRSMLIVTCWTSAWGYR
jgi:hypothetical protein